MDPTAQAQITDYINKSKATGKTDPEIKQSLLTAGWPESDLALFFPALQRQIQEKENPPSPVQQIPDPSTMPAFTQSYYTPPVTINPNQRKGPTGKTFLILGILTVIILVVIAASAYFYLSGKPSPEKETNKPKAKVTQPPGQKNFPTSSPKNKVNQPSQRKIDPATLSIFSENELKQLGVVLLPKGFAVQEEYKGVKFVKSPKKSFNKDQLGLFHRFLDLTPQKLLTPGPSAVVTYGEGEIDKGYDFGQLLTIAFASGPYMFFDEKAFGGGTLGGLTSDNSVDQAFISFEHELTHNAQFNEIKDDLANKLANTPKDQQLLWTKAALSSKFLTDFALIASWEKGSSDNESDYTLKNKTAEKTTDYGKTTVIEDMAETVSGIIATRDYQFSDTRKDWALQFLNESYDNLKKGKFPASSLFDPVKAFFPNYDLKKKDEYKAKYSLADEQVFYNEKVGTIEEVKNYLEPELKARGWDGTLTKEVKEDGVEIYKGDFTGNKRNMYIELRTYDKAKGYSQKPDGTQIVVVSGYELQN